jgi:hypothetical protein
MTIYSPYRIQAGVGLANAGTFGGNTLSLNHWNGPDGQTTFDDGITGVTWSRTGTSQIDTAQSQFGGASLLLPPGSTVLTNLTFSGFSESANWTFEGWVRKTGSAIPIATMVFSADFICEVTLISGAATAIYFNPAGSSFLTQTSNATLLNDTWYHWASVREGTNYSFFFDGTRRDFDSSTTNIANTDGITLAENENILDSCFFDETRLSQTARYSGATYTVPTAAFAVD